MPTGYFIKALAAAAFAEVALVQTLHGLSTNITSIADTTLSENWSSNNFGGLSFANSGTTQNFTRNRALYKFDVAAALPAGSVITSASLTLELLRAPGDGFSFADFSLRRVLVDWGEGNKISPTGNNAGTGSPAGTNEATWYYRFAYSTNVWAAPGGAVTTDFSAVRSSTQTVYGRGFSPYTWNSSSAMAADVQFWLDHPERNFGWVLLCEAESLAFTARGFASREYLYAPPQLFIDYLVRPRIENYQRAGARFYFVFTAEPGQAYIVEFSEDPASMSWGTLGSIPPQQERAGVLVIDAIAAPNRFYRVGTH